MRPVTLRVAGLRSYRRQRTLDFTNRTLMAVLGDTGSGKSSLLEALYGALYGGSTWDARGLGALIADGAKTLQIELVFTARGKTYKVARSTSRDNYPPSRHVLDCLDDREHVDGERNVNRRIEQIVGLTDQEFLRVVILPQGRFGQLLQGTAGERTPILRGILGLGVLDRVRDIADRQSTELAAALEPLTAARGRLYPSPAAIAALAAKEVAEHTATHQTLDQAATSIAAIDKSASAVEAVLPALTTAVTHAHGVDMSAALNASAAAEAAAAAVESDAQELRTRRHIHETSDADLTSKLAAAAAHGFTSELVARAEGALEHLVAALPTLHRDALEHADVHTTLTTRETALATERLAAAAAKDEAEQAKAALTRVETKAREAADDLRDAYRNLAALRKHLTTLAQRSAVLDPAATDLLVAALDLDKARTRLAAAQDSLTTAQDNLDALRAANQAAHVASGHTPGEPCPVCSRALPADFSPASIVGEDALKSALTDTQGRLTKAIADERAAERALDARRHRLLSAADSLAEAAGHAIEVADQAGWLTTSRIGATAQDTTATASAEALVDSAVATIVAASTVADGAQAKPSKALADQLRGGTAAAASKLAAFGADSPQALAVLEPLISRDAAAQQALSRAKDRAGELAARAAGIAATVTAAAGRLELDRQAHKARGGRIAQDAVGLVDQIQTLPAILADPLNAALNLPADDAAPALLAAPPLPMPIVTALRTTLSNRAEELAGWKDARDAARAAIGDVDRQLARLADVRRAQIDLPRATVRAALERAASAVRGLAGRLPALEVAWERLTEAAPRLPALPARGAGLDGDVNSDCTDAKLTGVSGAIATRLTDACAAVTAIGESAVDGVGQARGTIAATLAAARVPTVESLDAERAAATHLLRVSQTRLQRSQAQEPVASSLDEGLAGLRLRLAVLRAIKDVMSPSMFPKFVVTQRQTALLRIASSLLAKLTREAYGFSDEFMIVDRRTGQPRHTKTLSGGETFLASLALALALVEISNRSGGQLDALFLDEGFGSLDASILGDALDVLREQTTSGRLVGIISHLHAVAAELDDVLVVTKGIDGSDFRWLDEQERDHYLLDGADARLLA